MKTNVKTGSWIISIAIALAMALSVFCVVAVQPVSAASNSTYESFRPDYGRSSQLEKIGNYYIWYDGNKIKCSTKTKGSAKTIAKLSGKNKMMSQTAVSDGKNVYYMVNDTNKYPGTSTIYKTTVNGKNKKLKTISSFGEPAALYKGKLYFWADQSLRSKVRKAGTQDVSAEKTAALSAKKKEGGIIDLYAYDTSKKTVKLCVKDFRPYSGYGKYITSFKYTKTSVKSYIYNISTKKSKKLPSGGEEYKTDGKNVYFYKTGKNKVTVKQCSLSGKNVKTIKTLNASSLQFFGKKAAYYYDNKAKNYKKLTYKTKQVTDVEDELKDLI